MNDFDEELDRRLDAIRQQGLYRELRRVDTPQSPRVEIRGKEFLNFSSNDYLGLANHPALIEAALRAVERFGAGAGASRLICGSLAPHHDLEEALAAFKGSEAALTFATGYGAAIGTIPALVGKADIVILDKLVHASLVDAARLSGAKLRVFAHNDLNDLEAILRWADQRGANAPAGRRPRTLIVTETVFSMDGDFAPLPEFVQLKEKFGAWLMVDEAHATGIFGARGRGLVEHRGLAGRVEIQMGTLGKAVGAAGGYICGTRALINYLVNRARSFIFSTAPVPAGVAAAKAGIGLIQSEEGAARRYQLWARVEQFKSGLASDGSLLPAAASAIIPLIIGDEIAALKLAAALSEQYLYVPAIRYPPVARGQARLRVTMTAAHAADEVARLLAAWPQIKSQL